MICFKISIFALSDTTLSCSSKRSIKLWFALKLVSLHYQTQLSSCRYDSVYVVICFKISIFALSDTTPCFLNISPSVLWFALKLVSLHYQTQPSRITNSLTAVVICFKISIFALSDTTITALRTNCLKLWFALKLVSLHYQTQRLRKKQAWQLRCDLL